MNVIAVGTGAGLVSALLIAAVAKATPLALLLFLFAPVPVLIASLGWDHRAGLVATAVGGLATAFVASPADGLGFALGTALPAWWLAYLALLGRPLPDGSIEWYPLGSLLAWIAGTAALTFLAASLVSAGDYATFRANSRQLAELFLRAQTGTPAPAPLPTFGDVPAEAIVDRFAAAAPVFAAQGFTLVLVFYVWIGAKIVSVSGRLPRPWPQVPGTLMPRLVLLVLAGSVALANLGGFAGVFGLALSGALTMAFGLQGLAAIHELTKGRSGRIAILIGTYLLLLMSQGLILFFLFLFGIADTAFGIRTRIRARRQPGPGPSNT